MPIETNGFAGCEDLNLMVSPLQAVSQKGCGDDLHDEKEKDPIKAVKIARKRMSLIIEGFVSNKNSH